MCDDAADPGTEDDLTATAYLFAQKATAVVLVQKLNDQCTFSVSAAVSVDELHVHASPLIMHTCTASKARQNRISISPSLESSGSRAYADSFESCRQIYRAKHRANFRSLESPWKPPAAHLLLGAT